MFDFVFAVIAAGVNSAGGGGDTPVDIVSEPAQGTATIAAAPEVTVPEVAAPEVTAPTTTAPTISSPTVSIGENVNIGSTVVIGGATLLDGTAEEVTPLPLTASEVPTAPAIAAPAAQEFNMAVVPAGLVAEPQTPSGKFTTAAEVKPILSATKGNWVAVREYNGKDLLYVTHLWGWRCGLHAMAISVNDEPMQNWPLPACHMKYTTPNAILEEDGLPYLSLRLGAVETIEIQVVYDDLSMDRARFERGNVLIP